MRFLPDENISYRLCPHLKAAGHGVVHVAEISLTSADGQVILDRAGNEDQAIVSCDHDFAQRLFAAGDTDPSVSLAIVYSLRRGRSLITAAVYRTACNRALGPGECRPHQGQQFRPVPPARARPLFWRQRPMAAVVPGGRMHAQGGSRPPAGRWMRSRWYLRGQRYLVACGFLCSSVVAVMGFVREMAHSPTGWPLAAALGAAGGLASAAAWRRFLRMPKRRAIKSRLVNILAGVAALGLFIFLMALISQVLGDLMYRVVPISWLADGGVPFHPSSPSLPVDGAMAFVLTLLVMVTVVLVFRLGWPHLGRRDRFPDR